MRHVLKVGVALQSNLADYTEFDRKNYFYPDLPKGYQLSQFEYPLVSGGDLAGVSITRIHLEEDTASSIHDDATGSTVIDYNRAGVPLMELVTEPVIHSAEDAGKFARELQLLLRTLGVSEANMEKGEMRVEANVSVGKNGELGTKVEIKNLNSFNVMERAVRYEIERQKEILQNGGKIEQQTLGWDDKKQATFPQRSKEGSADYRYFPDPDLPSLKLSELAGYAKADLEQDMSELPDTKRQRYLALGLKREDADLFIRDNRFGSFFDQSLQHFETGNKGIILSANYIANDLVSLLAEKPIIRDIDTQDTISIGDIPISARNFNTIIEMVRDNKISSRAAKDTLAAFVRGEQGDVKKYVADKGLLQDISSDRIKEVVATILGKNAAAVADYKAGKEQSLQFLLGQCMRELKGAADPDALKTEIKAQLE